MMTIWKFPLKPVDRQVVEIPSGAQILAVQMQHGVPCFWALVRDDEERKKLGILIYGTGHRIEGPLGVYLGTFQMDNGKLVFHVFTDPFPIEP